MQLGRVRVFMLAPGDESGFPNWAVKLDPFGEVSALQKRLSVRGNFSGLARQVTAPNQCMQIASAAPRRRVAENARSGHPGALASSQASDSASPATSACHAAIDEASSGIATESQVSWSVCAAMYDTATEFSGSGWLL